MYCDYNSTLIKIRIASVIFLVPCLFVSRDEDYFFLHGDENRMKIAIKTRYNKYNNYKTRILSELKVTEQLASLPGYIIFHTLCTRAIKHSPQESY